MTASVVTTILLFTGVAAVAAAFAWYAGRGLFGRHEGRHADLPLAEAIEERPRRELAAPAITAAPDTVAELESMGRLRDTDGQRAGYWPMDATRPGTDVISYDDDPPPPFFSPIGDDGWICEEHDPGCRCGPCTQRSRPAELVKSDHDVTGEEAEEFRVRWEAASRQPAPVVVLTEDPAGRHEKPRTYQVDARPYCSKCGQYGHWTGQEQCEDIVVDELITRRRDGHVAEAIAGHLREHGFKVYPGGEDDAVDSIVMRALGAAIAAVDAARVSTDAS